MKLIILLALTALCFTSCSSLSNYSGPSVGFSVGYEGASATVTLFGKPVVKPTASLNVDDKAVLTATHQ